MDTISLRNFGFTTRIEGNKILKFAAFNLALILILSSMIVIVGAAGSPGYLTGFDAFDNMYQHHMSQEDETVNDIMLSVNEVVFFFIKLEMQLVGTLLLFICITSAAFAIWYAAKPEFADEVSEVKLRLAGGEQIPIDDPKAFFLQFCPDIKANSGIADSYEYEKPSLSLLVRDHLLKFILLFAVAIALMNSTLISFIVKAGNALAFGADYYVENTDFRGIVETWSTAANDYPVKFDTVTIKGKNQKKLYNAIYVALKKEKPRDRGEQFLERIGSKTQEFVESKAADAGVNYEYGNFIVNVFVTSQLNDKFDVSDLEIRMVEPMSTFGITSEDDNTSAGTISNKYVYVSVMQYDQVQEEGSSPYANASTYKGAWELGNRVYPTKLSVHKAYADAISDGYTFQGTTPTVVVKAKLSSGVTETITATVNKTSTSYVIDFSGLTSKVTSGISVDRIDISGLNSNSTGLVKGNTSKAVNGTATWTPAK